MLLWRAAQKIRENGVELPPLEAESTAEEILGAAVGVLRRRRNLTRAEFARRIGCTVEELLALEIGLLPPNLVKKYLSLIAREIGEDLTVAPSPEGHLKFA